MDTQVVVFCLVTQSVRYTVYLGYLVSDVLPSCFVLRTRSTTRCVIFENILIPQSQLQCDHTLFRFSMRGLIARLARDLVSGPRPFPHLRNKYRKWGGGGGGGGNEGKGLAHRVGLARQMECECGRNMRGCQTQTAVKRQRYSMTKGRRT